MEAIELLVMAHGEDFDDVAVGDEADVGVDLKPMVVVLDHHEIVAGVDLPFAEEDAVADGLVEEVGSLVGAAYQDDILLGAVGILAVEHLFEFAAGETLEVALQGAVEKGEHGRLVVGEAVDHLTYDRSVLEYA